MKGEGKKRIVAVLPPGDDSNSPEVLNSMNKGLSLRQWLEGMGHEYIVTGDKDPGSGVGYASCQCAEEIQKEMQMLADTWQILCNGHPYNAARPN